MTEKQYFDLKHVTIHFLIKVRSSVLDKRISISSSSFIIATLLTLIFSRDGVAEIFGAKIYIERGKNSFIQFYIVTPYNLEREIWRIQNIQLLRFTLFPLLSLSNFHKKLSSLLLFPLYFSSILHPSHLTLSRFDYVSILHPCILQSFSCFLFQIWRDVDLNTKYVLPTHKCVFYPEAHKIVRLNICFSIRLAFLRQVTRSEKEKFAKISFKHFENTDGRACYLRIAMADIMCALFFRYKGWSKMIRNSSPRGYRKFSNNFGA